MSLKFANFSLSVKIISLMQNNFCVNQSENELILSSMQQLLFSRIVFFEMILLDIFMLLFAERKLDCFGKSGLINNIEKTSHHRTADCSDIDTSVSNSFEYQQLPREFDEDVASFSDDFPTADNSFSSLNRSELSASDSSRGDNTECVNEQDAFSADVRGKVDIRKFSSEYAVNTSSTAWKQDVADTDTNSNRSDCKRDMIVDDNRNEVLCSPRDQISNNETCFSLSARHTTSDRRKSWSNPQFTDSPQQSLAVRTV